LIEPACVTGDGEKTAFSNAAPLSPEQTAAIEHHLARCAALDELTRLDQELGLTI